MAEAATRLLSCHATTAAAERNWSVWGRVYTATRNGLKVATAEKIIFILCSLSQPATAKDYEVSMDVLSMDSDDE